MSITTVTKEDVMNRMTDAIVVFGVAREYVTPDATFDELEVDSLDLVELAQIAEEDFGVELSVSDMTNVSTVGEAAELIYSRVG